MALLEGGRTKCVGAGDAAPPWFTNPTSTRRSSALTLGTGFSLGTLGLP
jgi:hypothetical protein